ncbi:cbb3-type cytochrome oxidase subunit 3 [Eleftheria terrae]|nr:cbb3-type cytochrome c oxidase subunit 3 [Eleftheria terrae]WKB52855.1 cbb3-type cytochrome c oxidase subunit 3 [Eleftheria terrae]
MNFDVNDLRTAVTLLSLAVFIGICAWAYARRNRSSFDEAARLPFQSE